MSIEFQFCRMKIVPDVNSGDGCTKTWMNLIPLNFKMVKISNLYVNAYLTTIKKNYFNICRKRVGPLIQYQSLPRPFKDRTTQFISIVLCTFF